MKNLLFLLLVLIGFNALGQNCTKFHTGEFRFNTELGEVVLIKNKTTQIERNKATNTEVHSDIKWITDCKCVLTCTKLVNFDIPELIGSKLYIEIVETIGNKSICRVTDGNGFEDTMEIIKVN